MNPLPGRFNVRDIKILDFGRGERLTERGHALFPFRFTDDRKPLDVTVVFEIELNVLP